MLTTIRQRFSLRKPETEAELHQFAMRLFLCCGLGYASLHIWFGLEPWNTPWRIPALGNLASGVINAVLISALFRFEPDNLRQHIERWRIVASGNLLLWLFNFAWLFSVDVGWSLDAFQVAYFLLVNIVVTLAILYELRRFARGLLDPSQE